MSSPVTPPFSWGATSNAALARVLSALGKVVWARPENTTAIINTMVEELEGVMGAPNQAQISTRLRSMRAAAGRTEDEEKQYREQAVRQAALKRKRRIENSEAREAQQMPEQQAASGAAAGTADAGAATVAEALAAAGLGPRQVFSAAQPTEQPAKGKRRKYEPDQLLLLQVRGSRGHVTAWSLRQLQACYASPQQLTIPSPSPPLPLGTHPRPPLPGGVRRAHAAAAAMGRRHRAADPHSRRAGLASDSPHALGPHPPLRTTPHLPTSAHVSVQVPPPPMGV